MSGAPRGREGTPATRPRPAPDADPAGLPDDGAIVDAHVHFWDPAELPYPWLDGIPGLRRSFLPSDYDAAHERVPVGRMVFVEANPRPDRFLDEARFVDFLAQVDPRISAIVALADLTDAARLPAALDALADVPRVRGVRHNIQGNPPGFCLQPAFVEGVRELADRGLTFDLCATHDQLQEVVYLARLCPETRLVLDHCGKPAIGEGRLDPWRQHLRELGKLEHVWCKLSGLVTEADPEHWSEDDLAPYAAHAVECFGPGRLMYGSDWPVLTLAGSASRWYQFTRRVTGGWSAEDRQRFYRGNAASFYGL